MIKTLLCKIQSKKVFFFVVLIGSLAFAISCKKKNNPLGLDTLPQENLMSSKGVDTFTIHTYTVVEDSVNSTNPEFNLIGTYNDEVFGQIQAGFYTQLTLSGFSPDFGNLTALTIDSAIMAFEYGGYYGYLNSQLFEAYEIVESMSEDSIYYRNSVLETASQNLVEIENNAGYILPDVDRPAIVGGDTLNPQLRIPMDKDFAKNLLQIAETAATDADFLESFKGIYFKVNNPPSFPGKGSILYLASSRPASKLTVYFTDEENEQNKFDFIITGRALDFNRVESDITGTKVEQVINNPEKGNVEYYSQAFFSRAKIDFPTINNLPSDIIIHEANLEIPINYYEGSHFTISNEINIIAKLFGDDENKYKIAGASFNKVRKAYVVDLRSYVQNIIKGQVENNGVFVSPSRFNTSMERIIFNGINSTNKKQPKLNIVYTKY